MKAVKMFDTELEAFEFFNRSTIAMSTKDEVTVEECECCGQWSASKADRPIRGGIVGPLFEEPRRSGDESILDHICGTCADSWKRWRKRRLG